MLALAGATAAVEQSFNKLSSSILIFPFQNLTNREDYEHICTGTSEELVRRLNYVRGLNAYSLSKIWSIDPASLKAAEFSLKGVAEFVREIDFDGQADSQRDG